MNNEIIKLENISKTYTDKTYNINVLQDLNLTIDKGDMIAITGTSGSGKSTLLHIMGLLDAPDSGKLYFHNAEISVNSKNVESFRNKNIGFVFQFHYLLADFTAIENVALPAVINGLSFKEAKIQASKLLEMLDLSGRLNHYPNQLSGGEQQRVSIARALINTPDIVIADEPTGNLDVNHSDEIVQILKDINQEISQTIILATHDLIIAAKMQKHYTIENSKLNRVF
jgi:lipoprotein-releasing system ATP-binding protein